MTGVQTCALPILSFINAASDSDIRWFSPPPILTANFSNSRRSGVVLRVSRIFVLVPFTSDTQRFVRVAIPLNLPRRFKAVRSIKSIFLVFPFARIKI